ncbi:MAG: transcription antitermination protein NusB [Actinomycetota bacterium]|jgi:N utilization substance protein B
MSTIEAAEARERALVLLYEAESRGSSVADVVAAEVVKPAQFAVELAQGVESNQSRYDALISSKARGWRLDRMPMIDRAILRLALHELATHGETPTAVVLNEAVELAKRYSTEDSGRFVNGVLAALVPEVR